MPRKSTLKCLSSSSCREPEVKSVRLVSIHVRRKYVENTSPLVSSVSGSLSILMLLFGGHSIPFLRLRVVSPSVVEECARVLYQLHIFVSVFHVVWARSMEVYLHTSKCR